MTTRIYIVQRKIKDSRRGDLGPSTFRTPVSAHASRSDAKVEADRRNKTSPFYTYSVRAGSLPLL